MAIESALSALSAVNVDSYLKTEWLCGRHQQR